MRGYDVDALMCLHESYYENWKYFQRWCQEKGIPMGVLPPPPPDASSNGRGTREQDIENMDKYYDSLSSSSSSLPSDIPPSMSLQDVIKDLRSRHTLRLRQLDTAAQRSRDAAWWPFAQHAHLKSDEEIMVIESAHGDMFSVYGERDQKRGTQNREENKASSTASSPSSPSTPTQDTPASANQLKPLFDGSASWWTQCLGHANPELTLAAAQAAGRYGHVIFATSTHLPALELTEKLLDTVGKGWADRVFFSDNGSTGMEVALKMALRSSALRMMARGDLHRGDRAALGVLGLKGSYHGDTIGAMDASEGGVYNEAVEWYRGRGYWLDAPIVRFEDGKPTIRFQGEQWEQLQDRQNEGEHRPLDQNVRAFNSMAEIYDVEARLRNNDPLTQTYRAFAERQLDLAKQQGIRLGALVLEPVVMGAGGQLFVDPLFQRILVDTARRLESLPVVFDEVYVGLYRLGQLTGGTVLGVKPDVSCHAKILTGGLLPLSVTLASRSIFECFLAPEKKDALLHGHSYTAHPVGCSVANKSLEIIQKLDASAPEWQEAKRAWQEASGTTTASKPPVPSSSSAMVNPFFSLWTQTFVEKVSCLDNVDAAMTMGTILVIHLKDTQNAGKQEWRVCCAGLPYGRPRIV